MSETPKYHFASFITPHGYGHAARAAAVMNAIREQQSGAMFEIFTRVPVWFFNMSLQSGFHYHETLTDIGLTQSTSMQEDLPETLQRLDSMLPFREEWVQSLAQQLQEAGCEIVLCDIAPLGIAVARAAGLPSVLIENFTWDWIYTGYLEKEPGFAPYIEYLHSVFGSADFHIRTKPACEYETQADLQTDVVSRKPRIPREEVRERLEVPQEAQMVLVTMGGILTEYPFLDRLEHSTDVRFLIPGGSDQYEQRGSLVLIPHHSSFFHPDLVGASDAVIGKLGYSTLAEAYSAGLPFAFVPREHFRESPPMGRFARQEMGAIELSEENFFNGQWLELLPDLLTQGKRPLPVTNGADQIASFLQTILTDRESRNV